MDEPGSDTALRRLIWLASCALLICMAFVALPGVAAAKKAAKPIGAVYSETNGVPANQLLVFNRYRDGHLKLAQKVSTGGKGGQQDEPGCPGQCPLLDAQGEVKVTNDGKWVFAVNAGSNTIASFRVGAARVSRVQVVPSGGVFPNSITIHGNVLYVLNTNSKNIAGFRISNQGKLSPIAGSKQSLTEEAAPLSRQIGFDNSGQWLVVSLLTNAGFDTFKVTNGRAGPATAHPSASPEPFAFSFDPRNNHMVSVEVVNDMDFNQFSNASSYRLNSGSGNLANISTVPTQGYAACWTEISADGKSLFVVNTGGPSPYGATVSTFALAQSGNLTFKSKTAKASEFTLTDEALTRSGAYLYVVSPLIKPPPAPEGSRIVTFKVGSAGKLTRIGQTTVPLAPGVSGLDVH